MIWHLPGCTDDTLRRGVPPSLKLMTAMPSLAHCGGKATFFF
jgi:hypothetical protein